jgi:hypothetical protein
MKNSFFIKLDGFVKGLSGVLGCILSRFSAGQTYCGVLLVVIHSSGFGFLASGTTYYALLLDNFLRVFQGRIGIKKIDKVFKSRYQK